MLKIVLLALGFLVSGLAVAAVTPSSYEVEAAYHQASDAPAGSYTTLASN
jgi:hypothetical protein